MRLKVILLSLFISSFGIALYSQKIEAVNNEFKPSSPKSREKVRLDVDAIRNLAVSAGRNQDFTIELQLGGDPVLFRASQNDVLEDASGQYGLFTFDIEAVEKNGYTGALTLSDHGIYATLLMDGKLIAIFPENFGRTEYHLIEYGIMADERRPGMVCGHDHSAQSPDRSMLNPKQGGFRSNFTIGSKRFNYRVAVVVTGEFYKNNGNADNTVRAAAVNTVNAISAIFNNEMSFRLSVGSRVNLTYKDPATDIFIPGGLPRTIQAANAVAMHFSAGSYDIGHVFHQHADGDGWENGGIAQLNSVCNSSDPSIVKARGWSGSYSNVGNAWINLATHEFGHQFGANHTFNGTGESCTGAISDFNAYEIGSGTTIMSYNGICQANQNIPGGGEIDNYFHVQSILEMFNFVYNGNGGSCGTPVDSPNALPQVNANPCNNALTVPKGTPFYLKAGGDWTDADNHTFCWEQTDEDGAGTPTQGKIGNAAASDPRAPLFRSFPPDKSSVRYFPSLQTLRSGTPSPFEVLPTVARTMNFQVSMRDNNSDGGALTTDGVSVSVANSGPLVVTAPAQGATIQAGTSVNITWNINGSVGLCSKVRIRLSTDGGRTYPLLIADNINYSGGAYNYSIPSNFLKTSAARFMIECMDADCGSFFNITPGDFSINSSCIADNSALCPTLPVSFDEGSPGLNLMMTKNVGNQLFVMNSTVTAGSTVGKVGVKGIAGLGCAEQTVRYERKSIFVQDAGTYQFSFVGEGWASIHRANYNPAFPCSSFIASTGTTSDSGGLFFGNGFTVPLQACTEYVILFFTYNQFLPANLSLTLDSGPGLVIEKKTITSGYQNVYLLVNNINGIITAAGQSTDFSNTSGGLYTLYSVVLDAAFDVSTLPGQLYAFIQNTLCINPGYNSRSIEIKSSCKITDITAGNQGACVPGSNFFTQELTIIYDKPPGNGQLNVNGQLFNITSSPQKVVLTDLDSDGTVRNVSAFFTESSNCKLDKSAVFTAPPNCCPLDFDLGPDKAACVGQMLQLDAGNDGTEYVWRKDGVVISGASQRILSVIESGSYEVQVTHSSGCKKSDKIVVTFNPNPVIDLPSAISFCKGSFVLLEGVASGAQSFSWSKDGVVISGANGTSYQASAAGSYRFEGTSAAGCTSSDVITVTESAVPEPNLGTDIETCAGNPLVLDGGTGGLNYVWFKDGTVIPGESGQTFKPTTSGSYKVEVINSANCKGTDDIKVTFNPLPVIRNLSEKVDGCRDKALTLNPDVEGFNTIRWKFNNAIIPGAVTPAFVVPQNQSGSYAIEASTDKGCIVTVSVDIVFRDNPVVDLGGSELLSCIGSSVELNAGSGGKTYNWTKDNAPLSEQGSILNISGGGIYAVTVTNEFSCASTDQIKVDFVPGPTVTLNGDKTLCEGEKHTITITTNASNPTISWFRDNVQLTGQSGLSLEVNTSGTYEVILKGGSPACEVRKSVKITVNPLPEFDLGSDRELCAGGTLPVLDGGSSNVSFVWLRDNQPFATTRTITADATGIYKLTATNTFGCSRTASVQVTINPLPELDIPAAFDLCEGSTVKIVPVSNAVRFEWIKDNDIIPGATGNSLDVSEPGLYKLQVFSAANCSRVRSFIVTERPRPVVNLGRDTTLCPGASLLLDGGFHSTYQWTDNSNARTLLVSAGTPDNAQSRSVGLTVTNIYGCSASDVVMISVLPVVKASVVADKPGICDEEPITLTASGGLKYQWSDPSGNTLSSLTTAVTVARPKETTTYSVTVSDGICPGNEKVTSIEIKKFEPVDVSAGPDTCVISGRTVRLGASGGVKYAWDNTDLIEGSSTIPNPVVRPDAETVFTVTITDVNGCQYEDDVKVCVKEDTFRPVSIITPNGDGKNDVLRFGGLADFPDNTLRIFNRWGNLVFEAEGYQVRGNLFEGMRGGERLPADTYYYILTFDGKIVKSSLTIVWD